MSGTARWGWLVVGVALGYTPGSAVADPSEEDRALATQLFKEGRALVNAGKHAEGCPKLEESQRLDPGGGTLLNLAACHEKVGKIATAWAEYAAAAAFAARDGRADREELAMKRVAALEPQLTRIQINVSEAAAQADLVITRNGVSIARAAWGTAMPLDPGSYIIAATAPGKAEWSTTISLSNAGVTVEVAVPELSPLPEPPPPQPPPIEPIKAPEPAPRKMADAPRQDLGTPFLIAGGVTAGAGTIGLAMGVAFGVVAADQRDSLDEICTDGRDACPTSAAEDISEMQTFAKASTGIFIVGGAAAATGLGLLFYGAIAGRNHRVALWPIVGPGSAAIAGAF